MMKTALTGVMSASRDLSVISNNLANAMTVGFKRSTAQFVDVAGLSQNDIPNVNISQGAMTDVVRRSDSQGGPQAARLIWLSSGRATSSMRTLTRPRPIPRRSRPLSTAVPARSRSPLRERLSTVATDAP